jgi:hypothetical protein
MKLLAVNSDLQSTFWSNELRRIFYLMQVSAWKLLSCVTVKSLLENRVGKPVFLVCKEHACHSLCHVEDFEKLCQIVGRWITEVIKSTAEENYTKKMVFVLYYVVSHVTLRWHISPCPRRHKLFYIYRSPRTEVTLLHTSVRAFSDTHCRTSVNCGHTPTEKHQKDHSKYQKKTNLQRKVTYNGESAYASICAVHSLDWNSAWGNLCFCLRRIS